MKWSEPENYVSNSGDILASVYYHKSFRDGEAVEAICNDGIEEIDGKQWEIFFVHKETKDAFYGVPLEGLGLMDCMIMKSDTRPFTEKELKKWAKRTGHMVGSHSGKVSYSFDMSVEPCKPLLS